MTDTKTTKPKKEAVTPKAGRYTEATGRRKTAVARVRMTEAKKTAYTCNDRSLESCFPTEDLRGVIQTPFKTVNIDTKFDISVHVKGGGMRAQAEAIRHGIARALSLIDPELRKPLKTAKLLTRDARAKERRKFGLKKARKAPQWSKR